MRSLRLSKRLWAAIIGLIVIGFILLFIIAFAWAQQQKGGQLLKEVLVAQENEGRVGRFACELPPVTDTTQQEKLKLAREKLLKPSPLVSPGSHVFLLQARIACLLGEYVNAVENYSIYVQSRSENPLGHLEFGYAYRAAGNLQASLDQWRQAGLNRENWENLSHRAFEQGEFSLAGQLYEELWLLDHELSPDSLFRWSISGVIGKTNYSGPEEYRIQEAYPLKSSVQIDTKDLQFVPLHGVPLSTYPAQDPGVGAFWWDGAAVAIVDVDAGGVFRVSFRVQNIPPAPIQIGLEIDNRMIAQIQTETEDFSWMENSVQVPLESGYHLIGLRFLNNGFANGIDRNAYTDRILIERIE